MSPTKSDASAGRSLLYQELQHVHPSAAKKLAAKENFDARIAERAPEERLLTKAERDEQLGHAMTVEELQAARHVEYGTYIASAQITHNGVLAFDVNHPVPLSIIERWQADEDPRLGMCERIAPERGPRKAPAQSTSSTTSGTAAKKEG